MRIAKRAGYDPAIHNAGVQVLLVRGFGVVAAYVAQVLLARWLGSTEYGVYSFAWSLAFLVAVLVRFGQGTVILRFLPIYLANKDESRLLGVLICTIGVTTLLSILVTILGLTVPRFVALEPRTIAWLSVATLLVPLLVYQDLARNISRVLGFTLVAFVPRELALHVLIIVGMAVAVAFKLSATAVTALAIIFAALLLPLIVQAALSIRALPRSLWHKTAQWEWPAWFSVAWRLVLVAGFLELTRRSDIVLIGFFLGPEEVSIYSAASRTAALIQVIPASMLAMVVSRFAVLHSDGKTAELQSLVASLVQSIFWPTLAISLVFAAASPWIIAVFGPDFRSGAITLSILAFANLSYAVRDPSSGILSVTGNQSALLRVYGVSTVIHVGVNSILIPAFGINAAALGTAIVLTASAVWLNVITNRELQIDCAPRALSRLAAVLRAPIKRR